MRVYERKRFENISATTAAFPLIGGRYRITTVATFGVGNVEFQTLAADQSTWIAVSSTITANGSEVVDLPPGSYRVAVNTATAVYIDITKIDF